jgi:hypothetical protein
MPFFNEQRLLNRLRNENIVGFNRYDNEYELQSKAETILRESINEQRTFSGRQRTYDVFLSNCTKDKKKVAGLKLEIEDMGYSVYVDWIDDPQLDRSKVDRATALLLQERMRNCRSLIYAFSEYSGGSKWMPWELGYFDGIKGKVAVLPISDRTGDTFQGTEYLGIYYYITVDTSNFTPQKESLWIHESAANYITFSGWLNNNSQPFNR